MQFALNPMFGQSPVADPNYLNSLIEHVKQHMTLWYVNRSNAYAAQSNAGKPISNYEDARYTATIDKIYTVAGAHIQLDTEHTFAQFQQGFAQIMQQAQQRQQQAASQLPPDAKVVQETAMAETQRKATKISRTRRSHKPSCKATWRANKPSCKQRHKDGKPEIQSREAIENAKITHSTVQAVLSQPLPPMGGEPPAAPPQQGAANGNV
jgi:hypothetical protein